MNNKILIVTPEEHLTLLADLMHAMVAEHQELSVYELEVVVDDLIGLIEFLKGDNS